MENEVIKICDFIKDRTIEYQLWINDLGDIGVDVPEFKILSRNEVRILLKQDIINAQVTALTGKKLERIIDSAISSLVKIYLKKLQEEGVNAQSHAHS